MEILKIVLSVVILLIITGFIFYYIQTDKILKEKESVIENLENEKSNLEVKVSSLEAEREKVNSFLLNISESKESKLINPTWSELKVFLESDDTNRLVYNESFDCSGFAIELFKRARNNGLRCGIVEVEYTGNETGHMLNVFQTVDRGLIFVDMTGNENGTGRDKIAYVEVGKPYGTIELNGIKEKRLSCTVSCSQFAKELSYVNYENIFDYRYFVDFDNCIKFYTSCSDSYNVVVNDYNKRTGMYTYSELKKWFENLDTLEKELVGVEFYFLSESSIVKDIEIYW